MRLCDERRIDMKLSRLKYLSRLGTVFLFLSLWGCSTARTLHGGDSQELSSIAFSGTRLNGAYWRCLYHDAEDPLEVTGFAVFGGVYLLPDFILSLAFDTVLFPYY